MQCQRRQNVKAQGTFPYIHEPLRNLDTYVAYINVETSLNVRQRAWLVPPTTPGAAVTAKLQTLAMTRGLDGAPQRARLETSTVGRLATVPQGTPVTLAVRNVNTGTTFYIGNDVDASSGALLYTLTTDLSGSPAPTWLTLVDVAGAASHPNLRSGISLTTTETGTRRVLRAVPTAEPAVLQLQWQYASAPLTGFPAQLLFVLTCGCAPCPGAICADAAVVPPPVGVWAQAAPRRLLETSTVAADDDNPDIV